MRRNMVVLQDSTHNPALKEVREKDLIRLRFHIMPMLMKYLFSLNCFLMRREKELAIVIVIYV